MSSRIEKKLVLQGNNTYDYNIDENGDFTHDTSYDTDIIVSLKTDRRANQTEIPSPEKRRGWHGDVDSTLTNYEIGSKLWLLFQSRFTQDTANDAKKYVQESLSWVTEKGIADRVHVTTQRSDYENLTILVNFYVGNQLIYNASYDVWRNSEIPNS